MVGTTSSVTDKGLRADCSVPDANRVGKKHVEAQGGIVCGSGQIQKGIVTLSGILIGITSIRRRIDRALAVKR